jgi:hypothetical protein
MTAQIPLSRIHGAARVVGSSRGAVKVKGRQSPSPAKGQRSGTVRTIVANSTPGFCFPMPAFDM